MTAEIKHFTCFHASFYQQVDRHGHQQTAGVVHVGYAKQISNKGPCISLSKYIEIKNTFLNSYIDLQLCLRYLQHRKYN